MQVCKANGCSTEFEHKFASGNRKYCDEHFVGASSTIGLWLKNIKNRAKQNGLDINISIDDLRDLYPDDMICPVLGIVMAHGDDTGRNTSPSIDRIDPNLGYTKGNIQVMSKLANSMKQNATPEQLLLFANWINKTYN